MDLSVFNESAVAPLDGAPQAAVTVAPQTTEQVADILAACSKDRRPVLIWGGGNHQGYGGKVEPEVVISTKNLHSVLGWRPDDLTLTVQGGATVSTVTQHVSGQHAILPQQHPDSTVGGILASGVAGFDQLRMGPPRDHLLGLTLVTGDGRVVKAGGTVVKNVSGYDLMRLTCGSHGSMGVITEVVLKLWPDAPAKGMVAVSDARASGMQAYRPTAVVETRKGAFVYLSGTEQEITAQVRGLGGQLAWGHHWPTLRLTPSVWELNVPASLVGQAINQLSTEQPYIAQHLVGMVTFGAEVDPKQLQSLREWAEKHDGSLTLVNSLAALPRDLDPWGALPSGTTIQRRLLQAFDPAHILNPGRHPVSGT